MQNERKKFPSKDLDNCARASTFALAFEREGAGRVIPDDVKKTLKSQQILKERDALAGMGNDA